ncbi:hypothetical protein HD806DRAFT_495057, partial [Xylariaceae sp. AK1471]
MAVRRLSNAHKAIDRRESWFYALRIGGCHHMICPIPHCGIHWCYICVEGLAETEVTLHFHKEHGQYL